MQGMQYNARSHGEKRKKIKILVIIRNCYSPIKISNHHVKSLDEQDGNFKEFTFRTKTSPINMMFGFVLE